MTKLTSSTWQHTLRPTNVEVRFTSACHILLDLRPLSRISSVCRDGISETQLTCGIASMVIPLAEKERLAGWPSRKLKASQCSFASQLRQKTKTSQSPHHEVNKWHTVWSSTQNAQHFNKFPTTTLSHNKSRPFGDNVRQ